LPFPFYDIASINYSVINGAPNEFSESSAQIKDENKDNDSDGKPGIPAAAVSVYEQKDNSKSTSKKLKRQSEMASTDMVTRKKGKLAKDTNHDGSTTSEVKQQACTCGVKTEKKKKSSMGKVLQQLYMFNIFCSSACAIVEGYKLCSQVYKLQIVF